MKLLATDMDGTFLRDDKSYSEEFNDLYNQMLKQGIQFVIASGNQYEALVCKFDEEIKNDKKQRIARAGMKLLKILEKVGKFENE
mgnify:CR=1 FL=1